MRIKAITIIVLVLTLLATSVAFAKTPVHQVSGGGKWEQWEPGHVEHYGFVAHIDSDGVSSGQGNIHVVNHPTLGDFSFHFTVNCLVVDGNKAWLGFVVTKTDNDIVTPIGVDATWQLQDNGEGANAAPDLLSMVFYTSMLPDLGLGNDCNDKPDLFSFGTTPWGPGNLQIR